MVRALLCIRGLRIVLRPAGKSDRSHRTSELGAARLGLPSCGVASIMRVARPECSSLAAQITAL